MNLQRITSFIALGGLLIAGCSINDPLPDPGPNPNAAIVVEDAEINAAFTDADNVVLFALQANGLGFGTEVDFFGDLCDGVEVKHFPENKRIVVDFGDGCTSSNGIIRKGRLFINYTGVIFFPSSSVTVNFQNYFVNGIKIEGTRISTNTGIDINNWTISFETKVNNGKLTWSDGSQASVTINHNRKFFLPNQDQGIRAEITGSSSGKSRMGVDFTSEIIDALVFVQTCTNTGNWIPSKGISIIGVSQSFVFEVDYGQGACDKEIQVRLEGETITMTLD